LSQEDADVVNEMEAWAIRSRVASRYPRPAHASSSATFKREGTL